MIDNRLFPNKFISYISHITYLTILCEECTLSLIAARLTCSLVNQLTCYTYIYMIEEFLNRALPSPTLIWQLGPFVFFYVLVVSLFESFLKKRYQVRTAYT